MSDYFLYSSQGSAIRATGHTLCSIAPIPKPERPFRVYVVTPISTIKMYISTSVAVLATIFSSSLAADVTVSGSSWGGSVTTQIGNVNCGQDVYHYIDNSCGGNAQVQLGDIVPDDCVPPAATYSGFTASDSCCAHLGNYYTVDSSPVCDPTPITPPRKLL